MRSLKVIKEYIFLLTNASCILNNVYRCFIKEDSEHIIFTNAEEFNINSSCETKTIGYCAVLVVITIHSTREFLLKITANYCSLLMLHHINNEGK